MEHLVVSSQNMGCCFDCLYFPSKGCADVNISIKHFILMKMHFPTAISSTEELSATLPKKLLSSNLNSLQKKIEKFTLQKKAMGKE